MNDDELMSLWYKLFHNTIPKLSVYVSQMSFLISHNDYNSYTFSFTDIK